MQNKGIVRLFAILLAIACVYYFSFTYFSAKTEGEAKDFAKDYVTKPGAQKLAANFAKGDSARKRIFIDSLEVATNDRYLDRLRTRPFMICSLHNILTKNVRRRVSILVLTFVVV